MAFLKSGNVLSPGGRLLCRLLRGPFVFNLCFIGVGNGTGGFKNTIYSGLFENLKMFYPPEGVCERSSRGVQLFLTYVLFPLVKGVWGFKNTICNPPFWKLENVLSPGGSLRTQLQRGPIVFNLCFISPSEGCLGFQNSYGESAFLKTWKRTLYLQFPFRIQRLSIYTTRRKAPSLRMGWMGWMGYQKCPSIFFILCGYIHKVYTYLYI